MGFADEDYRDKPIIAILNTWSELNTCHSHLRQRAEEVKRGIWQAGGFPVEVPVVSLGEMFMKPTTMLYRNLLAMEVEEVLALPPGGRGRVAGRLRQDRSRHADGRHHDRPADHLHAGRPHAQSPLAHGNAGQRQ